MTTIAGIPLIYNTETLWWRKEPPDQEGFWMWRKACTVTDKGKWRTFYVEKWSPVESREWTFWECGTDTEPPTGGWWLFVMEK